MHRRGNAPVQATEERSDEPDDLIFTSTCELSVHCHASPAADCSRPRPSQVASATTLCMRTPATKPCALVIPAAKIREDSCWMLMRRLRRR